MGELEPADPDRIQLLDQQNPEPVGADKPDRETNCHEAKIGSPVGKAIIVLHWVPRAVFVVGRQCSKA